MGSTARHTGLDLEDLNNLDDEVLPFMFDIKVMPEGVTKWNQPLDEHVLRQIKLLYRRIILRLTTLCQQFTDRHPKPHLRKVQMRTLS